MLGQIFLVFLRIGAFTLGAGYAMIPLIQRELVSKNNWLQDDEFLDTLAVAQSLPGPLAINTALGIGLRISGPAGALAAALGAALPSFLIILAISIWLPHYRDLPLVNAFFHGALPAVLVLLLQALYSLAKSSLRHGWPSYLIAGGGLVALLVFRLHPILVILASAVAGGVFLRPRSEKPAGGKEDAAK